LTNIQRLVRYDKVGAHLHYSVFKALGIETTDKWHKHARMRKPVCEGEDVTVLRHQGAHRQGSYSK